MVLLLRHRMVLHYLRVIIPVQFLRCTLENCKPISFKSTFDNCAANPMRAIAGLPGYPWGAAGAAMQADLAD